MTALEVCEAISDRSIIKTPEGEYNVVQVSFGYIVCESVKDGKLRGFGFDDLTFLTPQDIRRRQKNDRRQN